MHNIYQNAKFSCIFTEKLEIIILPELDLVVELLQSCSQNATMAESSTDWISVTLSPFEANLNKIAVK